MPHRPPLDPDRVGVAAGPSWPRVRVVERTTSTNADLLGEADVPDRSVLAAEEQTSGRGRLERAWSSPPRAGLLFSVALRPDVPLSRWGWLPLLSGVAVAAAVRDVAGVDATLKWPNDVLVSGAKLAGILVQSANGVAVVGVGANVTLTRDELPVPTATSLLLASPAEPPDRSDLLGAILARLGDRLERWSAAGGDAARSGLADAYRAVCSTLGTDVRVTLGDGTTVEGRAADIDDIGRIVVATPAGSRIIGAGDIEHLRPSG